TLIEKGSEFTGYDHTSGSAQITKYRKVKTKNKFVFQLVLDKTPFYAESGGQVGDTGVFIFGNEEINVIDTKKENDLIIHFTETIPEAFGGTLEVRVDEPRRREIRNHHTATHLLHAALRSVLG